ncbi:MAG TPA: ABC transporter transmembrane domain-containing protein, partial [Dehalococcoidia bacterium]
MRLVAISTGAGLAAAALSAGIALLLSAVIARLFLGGSGPDGVRGLMLATLALAVLRIGAGWAADVSGQRAAATAKAALLRDLVTKMRSLGPRVLNREQSGRLVSLATQGIEDLDAYFAHYLSLKRLVVLAPVFVTVLILAIDPPSAAVVLFAGPMLVMLLAVIGGKTRHLTDRRFEQMAWMSANFLDTLQGLPTLKMFGRSREQARAMRSVSRDHGAATMDVLRCAFETVFVLE